MNFLFEPLKKLAGYTATLQSLKSSKGPVEVVGPADSQKAHFTSAIASELGGKALYVAYNEMQAHRMLSDFQLFFGEDAILFPTREIVFFDVTAKSHESDRIRMQTLDRIVSGDFKIVVASTEALALKTLPRENFVGTSLIIKDGEQVDLHKITALLAQAGYERTDLVESVGHFAVRGGIVDVFPSGSDNAVRLELFDDLIDSIRTFDVETQRSIDKLSEVRIIPIGETDKGAKGCLLDYLGECNMFVDEPDRIAQRLENLLLEYDEDCRTMLEKGRIQKDFEQHYFRGIEEKIFTTKTLVLSVLGWGKARSEQQIRCVSGGAVSEDTYGVILAGGRSRAKRVAEHYQEQGKNYTFIETPISADFRKHGTIVTMGALHKSFEYKDIGFAIHTDIEPKDHLSERKGSNRKKVIKDAAKIASFTELKIGDFVVHGVHGIGQYVGTQQVTVEHVTKDYLKIKYNAEGFLYVPTSQLELIQKYIGSGDKAPKLNKLGGGEWTRIKQRVKESLMKLAEGLVRLYAQRQLLKGYKYSPDTVWQKQFEEMFPYEETDDQLRCVEEIKENMESDRPMDRLLCGDVGYGKTEVALRAIFKAVMDGRQVAYLCPTTVLAQQHYSNFIERFKEFPVTVEMVSRFRTEKETKKILREAAAGNVDVLIGTHKLLQKDIKYKNLGMLIVDEEQRFGVKHKERIKELSPDIDVLTLTATPIPRTLHMSLTGIRDISLLEEPPEERYPVQTYVMEYDASVVADAIQREIARGGQVFYLSNRVRGIELKAEELRKLMPDARFAVAHGQMHEHELEEVIQAFLNREFDVLVCTTIIELGIDMPNVNTMIVENAEMLGLAQLYQIRGRVGRSNRLAYAYITYKKDRVLAEQAEKRLQAIKEFTEFGSGFKIAMRDLEIRGAGNLLGPEQHGHMEAVGYETYCQLLDEAVRELKGEKIASKTTDDETVIDISLNAFLPERYIEAEATRIEMYRKIAIIRTDADALDVCDELMDRFGDIPKEALNLVEVALIKAFASKAGISKVSFEAGTATFSFSRAERFNLETISRLVSKYARRILVNASNNPYFTLKINSRNNDEIVNDIKEALKTL
ncbi:MAG: transcription-repair coupling factor [Bacillota bacterium]